MTIYPSVSFEEWRALSTAILARRVQRASKPNRALEIFGGVILGFAIGFLLATPSTRIAGLILTPAYALFIYLSKSAQRRRLLLVHRGTFEDMQPVLNGNRMEIDAHGMRGTWVDNKASYDFSWSAFAERWDRPNELVFLYAPCCYIRIPKQGLAPEEIEQISAWFDQSRAPSI